MGMTSDIQVISIHPLSLLEISDSYTRSNSDQRYVIGGLLGKNDSITHSFDILINEEGIDQAFLQSKLVQLKTIYPSHGFMGFYQVSKNLAPDGFLLDLVRVSGLVDDNSIYLTLNPGSPELLIKLYHLQDLQRPVMFKLESTPSERASLNSIEESVSKPSYLKRSDQYASANNSLKDTLYNLDTKIDKLITYLQSDAHDLEQDDELLMEIDKFLLEIEILRQDKSFTKKLANEKLQILMTVTSSLMLFLKHN